MSRASQVIVLAEDAMHQRFARRYLDRLGHSNHDVRFEPLPAGRGCGEQWVREHYAQAVKACRWRSKRAATALVVVIDADRGDTGRRLRQFEEALESARESPRDGADKIAHFVAKRNIETWILFLAGRDVDEDSDYSHEAISGRQIRDAAAAFHEWTRPNTPQPRRSIPSLLAAVPEARRLE